MYKNRPGQVIGAQMVTASDGSAFTSTVTVYVTGDGGTQALGEIGSGVCTHEGNGYHTYTPSQAETNYDLIAFTFIGTGAVPVTVQTETKVEQLIGTPANFGSGNSLAQNLLDMVFQESGTGSGTGYDRTTESLEALASRIGALQQSLGVAQTGDAYALVSDPTYGNAALQALLDVLALLVTDIRTKVGNPVNLGSGNSLASNLLDMTYEEAGSGTGTGYDRTTESLEALRTRLDSVLQTVLANLGTPQTGDAYGIVSNATYGNSAIRVVLDAIALLIGTPANFGTGNSLAANLIDMVFSESGTGSGTGYDRTTESLEGIANKLELVKHMVSADMEVNTSTTPWTVVYYVPGTSTVLFRKKLRDTVGADLTSESTIVGSQKEN